MIKIYLMVEINNKKSATDRYLNYIYNDKNLLDGRNIAETLIGRKGNNKKGKVPKTYIIKNIFEDFAYAVFRVRDPKPKGDEDLPPLETEEEAEKRISLKDEPKKEADKIMKRIKTKFSSEPDKEPLEDAKKGEGLKILTPNQLLTRLPIFLAQKKARNNSQKLNSEVRQII